MSAGPWVLDVFRTERGEAPVQAFVMFLRRRRIVLLDGEIKKRNDIPPKTLKRIRGYRDAVLRREASARKGRRT